MGKIAKLAPIKKNYTAAFRTFESSLAAHNFYRAPGTSRTFTPHMDGNGKYRTGLDKDAQFLRRLSKEAYDAECQLIDKTIAQLKEFFGDDVNLSPTSKIWNAFSNLEVKVSPVKIGNNEEYFDTDTGKGLLNYCWVRVHPSIAPSYEAYRRGEYPDAQYYLADEEAEAKMVYSRKSAVNKAIVEFESMTPTRKKQIARLMGIPIGDSTTEEQVYNEIDNLLKQTEFTAGEFKGLQTISVFNDLVQLDEARIKVKDLVEQSIRHSLYRVGPGGKIVEGNNTIATSRDELINYLLEDEHQMDLFALQKRLDAKKFTNVV